MSTETDQTLFQRIASFIKAKPSKAQSDAEAAAAEDDEDEMDGGDDEASEGKVKKDDDAFDDADDAQSFDEIFADSGAADIAEALVEHVDVMTAALHHSIASILADDTVEDKAELIAASFDQFKAAIAGVAPEGVVKSFAAGLVAGSGESDSGAAPGPGSEESDHIQVGKGLDMTDKANGAVMSAEDFQKALDTTVAKAVEVAIAKKDEEISGLKGTIEKMQSDAEQAEFANIAKSIGQPAEFGVTLRTLKKSDAAAYEDLVKRMSAQHVALTKSQLFHEVGSGKPASGSAAETLLAKAADLRKADPKLTEAQAFTKAYDADPELREAYKKERAALAA